MSRSRIVVGFLMVTATLMWTACSIEPSKVSEATDTASTETERFGPWLEGMGDHHHPITTDNPQTQKLFDQGVVLAYGFNHLEAERSFREAARLDPDCAMCYWGIAFARGPNINPLMDPENVPVAWEAMAKAKELAPSVSEQEQGYVEALAAQGKSAAGGGSG